MQLSLVIPCYNEATNLEALTHRCLHLLEMAPVEIILVDNGSTDNTAATLKQLVGSDDRFQLIRVPINKGYGNGILQGLAVARSGLMGWTHADLQTDPIDVERGIGILGKMDTSKALMVKGQRYSRPLSDSLFTAGMSAFESVLLRARMWDINAQPTLFTRALYEQWEKPPDDFSLDLYAYYQAIQAGHEVIRFPVIFGDRFSGQSHWNIDFRSKSKFIRRTISYSLELARTSR